MRSILCQLLLLVSFNVLGQTQQEWADHVGWDGISHWSEYLIFSPKFSGPNAMPVPEITTGRVQNASYLAIGGQYQAITGDQTGNLTLYGAHTFLKNRVSLDLFMVPIECYELSDERKLERNVYYQHWDKKTAIGDLYINVNFQFLEENKNKVDLAARIGIKTASSGLDNPARFIDSPGYYFDASVGKTLSTERLTVRPYVMLGFFAWQTNDESLRQNDAVLFGIGVDVTSGAWTLRQNFRGYSGYHDIGDRPQILQTALWRELGCHQLIFRYQKGLRDYLYHSFELAFLYTFKRY